MNPRTRTLTDARTLLAAATLLAFGCATGNYDESGRRRPAAGAQRTSQPAAEPAEAVAPTEAALETAKVERAFPTGDRRTSAVLLEKEMPREVVLGAETEYRIRVQNLTDAPLETVQVTDTIPAIFTVESTEPVGTVAGGVASWNVGTIAPRASKTLVVRGRATEVGALQTCATVDYEAKLCAVTQVVAPSIGVEVRSVETALVCDPLQLTVAVTNSGSGDARDVRVVHELPEGLLTRSGQRRIELRFGTLSTLQSKEKTIDLEATQAGTFVHEVRAEGAGGLEAVAEPVTVVLGEPRLDLTVTQPERAVAGQPVGIGVAVSNTGNGISGETLLRLKLSREFDLVSASDDGELIDGEVVWAIGELEPGASREVSMRFGGDDAGTVVTEVKAQGHCAAEVTGTGRTEIRGLPSLALEVSDSSDFVLVGNEVTYTIRVENRGTAPDSNIVISCDAEEGVEIVSTSTGATATNGGRSVSFAAVETLGAGGSFEFEVTVRSTKELDSRFNVSLTSEQKTRPVVEAEATNFYK